LIEAAAVETRREVNKLPLAEVSSSAQPQKKQQLKIIDSKSLAKEKKNCIQ
jgi:hypothetical protein